MPLKSGFTRNKILVKRKQMENNVNSLLMLNGRRNENFGRNWFIVSFLLSYEMENLISSLLESFHWNSKYFSTLHPSFRLEKDVMNS